MNNWRGIQNKLENNAVVVGIFNRKVFTIAYLVICIFWFFPLLGGYIDFISKMSFIWGAMIIGWDFITKRRILRSPFGTLITILLFGYIATILYNINSGVYMNVKHLIYNGILLLVIYVQEPDSTPYELKKTLLHINNIIIYIALLAATISIITFLLNISFIIKQEGSVALRFGFIENRLFGVYTSPNTGALFGIISIVAGSINSLINTGSIFKWRNIYFVNAVIQFIFYTLSLSHGGFMTYGALLLIFSAVFIYPVLIKKKKKIIGALLSVGCFLGLLGMMLLLTSCFRYVMVQSANGIKEVLNANNNPTPTVVEDNLNGQDPTPTVVEDNLNGQDEGIKLERIETGNDLSNGRLTIWRAGVKLWIHSPIFGIGNANVYNLTDDNLIYPIDESVLTKSEIYWLKRVDGNMHNIFVQVLVCTGILGLALFIVLAFKIASRYISFLYRGKINDFNYKLIGLIFCLISALVVNGLVETHLLFNRQDPYGVIFWAYTGIGLLLIKKQSEIVNKEKFAFLCDTPYQVFGAINFVANNIEGAASYSDIYIYRQFKNAEEISARLKDSGLFCHVYDVKPYNCNKVWYTKLRTLWRFLFPKHILRKHILDRSPDLKNQYGSIVIFFFTPFTLSFRQLNPVARVILLEDGTGSYFGNIEKDFCSRTFNFFNRFFMNGMLDYRPQRLYVNNPALCSATVAEDIRELPRLDANNLALDVLNSVFNYRGNSAYKDKRIVYLTQPFNEVKGSLSGAHEALLGELQLYSKETIVRVHPRQQNVNTAGLTVDEMNNLWELECVHCLTDEHVLVAAFSTAQLVPKLLCDAEPYLVFVYRLFFFDINSDYWRGAAALVGKLKTLYRNPEKVLVPQSWEEFSTILRRMIKKV